MSKIDWDRPLEAYHEDGRCAPASIVRYCDGDYLVHSDAMPEDGDWYFDKEGMFDFDGWRVRNVTEPKADIEAWAYSIVSDLEDAEVHETYGYTRLRDAFARYVMTKEEAPVDPDLIAAREVVCGYHHDKHPESPWHVGHAEIVRSGRLDNMLDVQAAYHGIKRGRILEQGEGK
jgi:hypothetical protein